LSTIEEYAHAIGYDDGWSYHSCSRPWPTSM